MRRDNIEQPGNEEILHESRPIENFTMAIARSVSREFLVEMLVEAKTLSPNDSNHHDWANLETALMMINKEQEKS
jgi:hypothetical protein